MRKIFYLCSILASVLFITSCDNNTNQEPPVNDPTIFTRSSIVGVWACIASDHLTYDIFTGEQTYHWDYDPNAQTYDVLWYFDIKSDSKVQYVNVIGQDKGEYRKSDGYLHIPVNSEWKSIIDANYIFDQEHQAIRCPSGKVMGFTLENTKELLGTDTIFYVKRYGIDEAAIMDNTGLIQSQYVVRVKGIKRDL